LNYSSLPPENYVEIIDTCYWPILDIIDDYNFKTGIEFPVNTIKEIQKIDPLFLEKLQKYVDKNKCEIICSSKEQVVFPLAPKSANLKNLNEGKKETEGIFSVNCKTAFVNEQLFSSGLVPLYSQNNFENIISIWEWASKFFEFNNNNKFHPRILDDGANQINFIWNSYIAYQKFQRYVNAEISKEEYLQYILNQKKEVDSCFPFYGSDMEIFGYPNPVLGLKGRGNEVQRFRKILDDLEKNPDLEFILPQEVIEKFPPKEKINIKSAKFAILGKKQDKFIVTRWATCGRDNGKSNSICYSILKKIRILEGFGASKNELDQYFSRLIDCWASDYRTHAIESKYLKFQNISSHLNLQLEKEVDKQKQNIANKDEDLQLFNPNNKDWNKIPFEVQLYFKPRTIKSNFKLFVDGKEVPCQLDDKRFYKDGSVQSATLVFEPEIRKKSTASINIESNAILTKSEKIPLEKISTENVELSVISRRGAAISELRFPKIEEKPLFGFLEHGTFEDPTLSADFYSGHTVVFDREGKKFADLENVETFSENGISRIRKKIFCDISMPIGNLTKIFQIYQNHPRIDLKYIFNFKGFRPASFRTGILTLKPEAFEKKSLMYSTHNGGDLESFFLEGDTITQDESSDPRLSNQGCLGSTEGIIDLGDSKKGITLFTDKSITYSVPMINFRDMGEKFFYRVSNSISELDDTTMTWWKGRKEVKFSIMGRGTNIEENIDTGELMSVGLLCISRNENIKVES
jgi:hypothetical protein